jgi:hypothetical protein
VDWVETVASTSPVVVRGVVGVSGAIVALAGARIYRPSLFLGAFAVGVIGASMLLSSALPYLPAAMHQQEAAIAVALAGGVVAAGSAAYIHRIGLVLVGAVVGLAATLAIASLAGLTPWIGLVGAAIGAVAFPFVYPKLLEVLTPAVGAAMIAWAAGLPHAVWILVPVFVIGCAVQLGGRDKKK